VSRTLRLAADLALPLEAATQTFLVVGKRNSGKSSTAKRLAEQLVRAGVPVVVVDPVDRWWGLKAARDGKNPGLKVHVFGGTHADLPLEPTGGALIADVLVEHRISAVLAVRQWTEADKARFLADFAARLFQRNTRPLHLVLEEAHEAAPQQPWKGDERMLHHVNRIWKLGRNNGIGGTAVTQRPASLNKNVTTQAEILVLHRTIGPQDVAAVRDWIRYHGEREDVLAELAGLKTGECFVWAPDFPEAEPIGLKRVRILEPDTFDSFATPKVGEERQEPKELAAVDIARLRGQMAATMERAKQDDPRELKRRVAELEADAKKRPVAKSEQVVRGIARRVEVAVLKPAQAAAFERGVVRLDKMVERAGAILRATEDLSRMAENLRAQVTRYTVAREQAPAPLPVRLTRATVDDVSRMAAAVRAREAGGDDMGPMRRRMLSALAQHPAGLTKRQVLIHADYRSSGATSGTFAALAREGLVAAEAGLVRITDVGLGVLGPFEPLPTGAAFREHLLTGPKLGPMEKAFLKALFDGYPRGASKKAVLEATGYRSSGATSGVFAKFRALGWAVPDGGGGIRAADEFYAP
jgi:hypothetical protein